jgi:hypothetical protein
MSDFCFILLLSAHFWIVVLLVTYASSIWSINKPLELCRFVVSRQKAFVETIEPSGGGLSMELGFTSELRFAV